MAEFKGTKSKWKNISNDIISNGKLVATSFGFYINEKYVHTEETKANAKLIAAAPDLLEALIASKAIFEAQGIDENHSIVGDQYKKIIKAIKKATE